MGISFLSSSEDQTIPKEVVCSIFSRTVKHPRRRLEHTIYILEHIEASIRSTYLIYRVPMIKLPVRFVLKYPAEILPACDPVLPSTPIHDELLPWG
jgi:hypothetical protein